MILTNNTLSKRFFLVSLMFVFFVPKRNWTKQKVTSKRGRGKEKIRVFLYPKCFNMFVCMCFSFWKNKEQKTNTQYTAAKRWVPISQYTPKNIKIPNAQDNHIFHTNYTPPETYVSFLRRCTPFDNICVCMWQQDCDRYNFW